MAVLKIAFFVLAALSVAAFAGGWTTDRFGGSASHTDMDSLPFYVISIVLLAFAALDGALWFIVYKMLQV